MKCISVALLASVVGFSFAMQLPAAAAKQSSLSTLYSFEGAPDGAGPYSNLADVNGVLYGTTSDGGATGYGTVFSLVPGKKKSIETAVYSFCSEKSCQDGKSPLAGLININGTLYGTSYKGGASRSGAVFTFDPATGTEHTLYSFGNGADGAFPSAGLIEVNGTLYGTTQGGGSNGKGTVFSLDPTTGTENVVYSFCGQQACADGERPEAGLIDVSSVLYGTTQSGGANGKGTVFSVDPTTGTGQVVYSFCSQQKCADGEFPLSSLVNVNGTLYGTTFGGGAHASYGTVFAVNLATDTETVLYSFCGKKNCTDGQFPDAGLINVKGVLYGTTVYGGATNGGEVFSINPGSGALNVAYSFCSQQGCLDGGFPVAGLLNEKGTLYGTTQSGGGTGYGTVFALTNP